MDFFFLLIPSSESFVVCLLTSVSLLSFITSSRTKTAITCLSSCAFFFLFSLSLSRARLSFSLSPRMEETTLWGDLFARRSISFVSSPSSLERRRRSPRSSPRREKDDTTHFCWRSNDGARSISRSIVADENTIHVKTQQQNSSSETPVLGNPASSFASRTTRTKSRTSAPSGWTLKSELWNWKGKR